MSAIYGETLILTQCNGPDVELVVYGDEFYARYETVDGYTAVYDTDLGLFCYAVLLDGRFSSSGSIIAKQPPPDLRRHLKESAKVRNEKFNLRYNRIMPPADVEAGHRMRTFGMAQGLLPGRRVSQGSVRGLTILVDFADERSAVPVADVDAMLNGVGYSRNGNFCSVREYFAKMSSGKLDFTNRVVGPIRLSQKRDYYKTTLLVREALELAVSQFGVDLGEFDSKGEGIVDALNFLYAGRTLYEGELWPHNSFIDLVFGGIRTNFYMLTSLGRQSIDLSIGTFCHENGHQLCRFPDLYDYGTRDGDFEKSQGIGRYCLMSSGNHLNNGRTPAPVTAYYRYLVGWHDRLVSLNGTGSFEARHGDYGTILKYDTDKPNEYFLIENRCRMGLDAYLPSSGLAVYHCDTLGSNEWQGGSATQHYQCGLMQADGHLDLELNRNYGDEGDFFASVSGVALSHATTPSSLSWDGADSGFFLRDVSAPGEIIRFSVGEPVVAQGTMASASVTADMLIPDNLPGGIHSPLRLEAVGRVKTIQVGVEIIHPYIGDLQVELESPTGKRVMLHDRVGGSGDDIREIWMSAVLDKLQSFVGDPVAGVWVLHVCDLGLRDTGRLIGWNLEIEYQATQEVIEESATPALAIPDANSEGAESCITIAETGQVKEVVVSLGITHSYIGDLRVELAAPSGQRAILHNRTGGSIDNIRGTYDKNSAPGLETLIGEEVRGDWTLKVYDLAPQDVGTLDVWAIRLIC